MAPIPNLIDSEIATLTHYFETTGNVAAAWRVFHLAREHSRPIPNSVAAEIDRFAAGVSSVAEKAVMAEVGAHPVRFRAEDIYEVWRNGQKNPVGLLQDEWRDYRIFDAVLKLVESGRKVGAARSAVADQRGIGVGTETIKRIWQRFNRGG